MIKFMQKEYDVLVCTTIIETGIDIQNVNTIIVNQNDSGDWVGDLCFKGLPENGQPEIGYGLLPEYEHQGYATEAVRAACRWAFEQPGVTAVEAETAPDHAASQAVLHRVGFVPTGTMGAEGPRFILRQKP